MVVAWGDCFFEIPIYRCTSDKYDKETERELAKHINSAAAPGLGVTDSAKNFMTEYYWTRVWAPWEYNDVIGWVRLLAAKHRIEAECFRVDARRLIRRPRRKRFKWIQKVFHINFEEAQSSSEIFEITRNRVTALTKDRPFKGRHVDLRAFDHIGRYIDWRLLLGFEE